MFVLRVVFPFALLFVLALGGAYLATRERKFLRVAGKTVQALAFLGVAFTLVYLFARVLRFA